MHARILDVGELAHSDVDTHSDMDTHADMVTPSDMDTRSDMDTHADMETHADMDTHADMAICIVQCRDVVTSSRFDHYEIVTFIDDFACHGCSNGSCYGCDTGRWRNAYQ